MASHFDHDPAEKNSIKNAAKKEESQMEIVDKIWTNVVKEWLPQSEVMFLRYSGFALPLLTNFKLQILTNMSCIITFCQNALITKNQKNSQ